MLMFLTLKTTKFIKRIVFCLYFLSFLVLPTFQVSIDFDKPYVLPSDMAIMGTVEAIYR